MRPGRIESGEQGDAERPGQALGDAEQGIAVGHLGGIEVPEQFIEELWAQDASYTDPIAQAQGRDAIDATIAAVQGQFPGFVFTLLGPLDAHHRQARFTWGLGPADAEAAVVGFDVAVAGEDGKLTSVYGFLDKVPS